MPWADTRSPSIQTGCLKAYVHRCFGRRVFVRDYAGHLDVPLRVARGGFSDLWIRYRMCGGEFLSQIACEKRCDPAPAPDAPSFNRVLKRLEREMARSDHGPEASRWRLNRRLVGRFASACESFAQDSLVPGLKPDALNLVGFTLTFNQLYASALVARHLAERCRDYRMVFLFGGASVTTVRGFELLGRLVPEAFVVVGEGERKLAGIIRACLDADPCATPEQLRARIRGCAPRVLSVVESPDFLAPNPGYFDNQLAMEDLPVPDYSDYFDTLRDWCGNEAVYRRMTGDFVSLPVEGSRGCFARCDFCSLNRLWSGFRKHSAGLIVETVRELRRRYGAHPVYFTDNVCDAWAERYADLRIVSGQSVPVLFMEMRASQPERFWTKLSLAGVETVQVGVEALSQPLLAGMRKGTHVVQNLRSHKYMQELGIQPRSNLILDHPRSTLKDVVETRRILRQIPHLTSFYISWFALDEGSPLYRQLSLEERKALKPRFPLRLPRSLQARAMSFRFLTPNHWKKPGVEQAWKKFARWYRAFVRQPRVRTSRLDVLECSEDRLRVRDERLGRKSEHELPAPFPAVYRLCHHGPTLASLETETRLPPRRLRTVLAELLKRELLIRVDDHYLALALRPRDELIRNCLATAVSPERTDRAASN